MFQQRLYTAYSLPIQTNVQANASGFVDASATIKRRSGSADSYIGGTSPYEYSLDAGTTWVRLLPRQQSLIWCSALPYSILVRDVPVINARLKSV